MKFKGLSPEEYSIKLEVCNSFDFMFDFLEKKDYKNIGIDYENNLIRFKDDDDESIRICS